MARPAISETGRQYYHGLAFLALLAFIIALGISRLFTTLFPGTIVETGGIHFHHFWYGLAMVFVSGWIGIVTSAKRYRALIAVVFGFGGGLIADEAGLLLTLGNYHSPLTYPVVLGIVVGAILIILAVHSGKYVIEDLRGIPRGDWIILAGIIVSGVSSIAFPAKQIDITVIALVAGAALIVGGIFERKWQT